MHSLLMFHAAASERGDGLLAQIVALLQSQVAANNNQKCEHGDRQIRLAVDSEERTYGKDPERTPG